MTFPVPGGATFLRSRSNLADVASPAAALADLGGLGLVATTGLPGFTLQNGTPNIISWTAPNDGQLHRFIVFSELVVTVAQTGGSINVSFTDAGGGVRSRILYAGGLGTGFTQPNGNTPALGTIVAPGSVCTVVEATAQTLGAAVLYAEIWAL